MTERRAPCGVVSLLTDFGLRDPYAGIMKGVVLRENPALTVVDLSHEVPPQDVAVGAFWIERSFRFFPAGTVHVCVVDPGVGTARAALAVEACGHYFVAPDNGLLSDVLAGASGPSVHRVELAKVGIEPSSRTFHGRDVFAPVAARLASGHLSLVDVGPPHGALMERREIPARDAAGVSGTVLFADRFGNLVTNIPSELVDAERDCVHVAGRRLRVVGTYAEAAPDECVGIVSSFDTLEVAQRNGSARATLGVERGARLLLRTREVDR